MSIFQRLFSVGKSEVNAAIDKMEDPIKMTEQGIRDLKKDLNAAMTSLAEVKGQGRRSLCHRNPRQINLNIHYRKR